MKFQLVDYWRQAAKLYSMRFQILTGIVTTYVLLQPSIDASLSTIFGVTLSGLLHGLAGERWFAWFVLVSVAATIVSRVIKQAVTDTTDQPK